MERLSETAKYKIVFHARDIKGYADINGKAITEGWNTVYINELIDESIESVLSLLNPTFNGELSNISLFLNKP
jgi:hypothetical protein